MHLYKGHNYLPWKPLQLSKVRKARFKDLFCRITQATHLISLHFSFPICKDVSLLILFTHAFMACQERSLISRPGLGAPLPSDSGQLWLPQGGGRRVVGALLRHTLCSPFSMWAAHHSLDLGIPGTPIPERSQSSWRKMHVDVLFASPRRC